MYKVIICDDEMSARKNLKASINWESLDFEIVGMFKNGEEAMEYIKGNPVDVVLTDIKMPKMDGVELSRTLYEAYPEIKVIIFSAHREFKYARAAVHYHVFDYILKPIDYDEFYVTLENLNIVLASRKLPKHFFADSIYTQRSNYLSKAFLGEEDLSRLSLKLKKTNLYIDLTKSSAAHIKILLKNFNEILDTTWKYSKIFINTVFTNFLSPETNMCLYTLLTIHKNVLEIFVVSKTSCDIKSFEAEINDYCADFSQKLEKNFELEAKYDIVQLCDSIYNIDPQKSSIFYKNPSSKSEDFVNKIIEYINEHYAEDITLDDIASKLYMNPCKISRLLKKHTDESYVSYITGLRIKKAKYLLKNTDTKISAIGELVGYKYDKYFYKVFKNYVGVSPSDYRKSFEEKE